MYVAPRIGNTIFAAFVNRKIPSSYRVEVDTDIVTVIPKVFRMYRHAGIPVVVDSDEAGKFYRSAYMYYLNKPIYKYMYACVVSNANYSGFS